MKSYIKKYFKTCPKSGKLIGLKSEGEYSKLIIPFIGLLAILWIIFRVATKPSRITYPCVRVAMPIASSFIAYFVLPALAIFAWLRARKNQVTATALFAIAGFGGTYMLDSDILGERSIQLATIVQPANQPIGTAVGIFPGRVAWVHNPDATNQNWVASTNSGTGWFLPANNNQNVIDKMISAAIQKLTEQTTDSSAWKAIFEFHNNTRGKGAINYKSGEKIFIKTNAVSGWFGNYNAFDLSKTANSWYNISETSPAVVLSVLRQLVNVVGVRQQDIYVGDPLRHIYKHCYDLWHSEFPDVHYLDYSGYENLGREKVVKSATAKIIYSDRGAVLRNNTNSAYGTEPIYKDTLYTVFEDAEYLINLPILKGHRRAGTTMFAKNHFGSHTRDGAAHLHSGLVAPLEMEKGIDRPGYGLYRVQVDFMCHALLGKKNLVYLMDALWATNHELASPLKWQMAPFNNDYMSSVFASFDPVAIESVGYDFLRAEFTSSRNPLVGTYVQMPGVDDYLHQAADSSNWPAGIKYDPDSTSTYFRSLGVHEHWNDAVNKQYSRNLGNGDGIELVKVSGSVFVDNYNATKPQEFVLYQNYPNPFNPTTTIEYNISVNAHVNIIIYDIQGKRITTLVDGVQSARSYRIEWNASNFSSGLYICRFNANSIDGSKSFTDVKRLMLLK